MIKVWIDDSKNKLCSTFYGENFRDLMEVFMKYRIGFNDKSKAYVFDISLFPDIIQDAKDIGEDIDIDMYTQKCINEFFSKSELKSSKVRLLFKKDLMTMPPLKGIPPNETFHLDDIKRGLGQNRFLYHHDMGLGKSYSITALIEHLRYYGKIDKCLVMSSNIGVKNVKKEILKFSTTLKEEDILEVISVAKVKFEDRNIFDTDKYPQKIMVLSYDVLKSVSNYYFDREKGTKKNPHPSTRTDYRKGFIPLKKWLGDKPGGLFLDECHNLASPKSRRTEIINMIIPEFEYRYLFTGTLSDKYEKLYEPCWILDPALVEFKKYDSWLSSYNNRGTKFSQYAINPEGWDLLKIEELNKKLLKDYCAKRKLTECLDMPPMVMVPIIYVEMSKIQRDIYEKFSNQSSTIVYALSQKNGDFSQRMVNLFPYLQMSVDNPSCLKDSRNFEKFTPELQQLIEKYDYNKDNEKIKVVDDIIQEKLEEDKRGILWYYHPQTQKALEERYKKYKPVIVNRELSSDDRLKMVDEFKNNPEHKILIASILILNTSVTITEAKYQVYVEKTYNYVEYDQSLHRIWRNGQTDVTETYSIRFDQSIDNLQELNLQCKGNLINALLNKEFIEKGMWKKIFNLTKDDNERSLIS